MASQRTSARAAAAASAAQTPEEPERLTVESLERTLREAAGYTERRLHETAQQTEHQLDEKLRPVMQMLEQLSSAMSEQQQQRQAQQQQHAAPAADYVDQARPPSVAPLRPPSVEPSAWGSQTSSSTSIAKELLRTVPLFSGDSTTPQLLIEFIHKMNLYFRAAELPPSSEVMLAISKLTSTAHTWWMQLEAAHTAPTTWPQMQSALHKRFTPPAFHVTILDKIDDLTQTSTVVVYNNAFNKLIMQLPTMDPMTVRHRYCKGLKRPIYTAIIAQPLEELSDLQAAAVQQEQMTTGREKQPPNKPPTVEAHSAAQDKNKERKQHSKTKPPSKQNTKREPLFPCALCDKEGHFTAKCPGIAKAKELYKNAEANLTLSTNARSSYSIAVDSCATNHIVKDVFLLTDLRSISPISISGINKDNTPLVAKQAGTLKIQDITTDASLVLEDVLYLPEAQRNLVSTDPLLDAGYQVTFGKSSAITRDGIRVLDIRRDGRLPFLEGYVDTPVSVYTTEATKDTTATSLNYGTSVLGTSDLALFKLRI